MKKVTTVLFLLLVCCELDAQTTYQRAIYGANLLFTKGNVTSDGGLIVIGRKYTTINDEDIYLIRLNADGDTLWTRTYLNPNADDYPSEVYQTKDGGFFVIGWYYVMKTDSIGSPIWAKRISASGNSLSRTGLETSSGEFVVASRAWFSSGIGEGVQLTKLDSSGNLIFNKLLGVFDNPYPYSIRNTIDGGYIIAGETSYAFSTSDAFLMKTDSAGNVSWAHHYGSNTYDSFWGVEQTLSGEYLAIGGTSNPQETFLVKVDSSGSLIWSRIYQSGNSHSMGQMIIRTSDQNFVFCGFIQLPHASIIGKMDENGIVLWAKAYRAGNFSNSSRFNGVYEDSTKCLYATGSYVEVPWIGFNHIVKCDSMGNSNCFASNLTLTSTPVISKDSAIVSVTANGFLSSIIIQTECFCDSTNLICSGFVGLNETSENIYNVTVYPNPFSEKIYFEIDNSVVSEIVIYDLESRIVFQSKFISSTSINLDGLAKGIYIYILRNDKSLFLTGKLVKIQ